MARKTTKRKAMKSSTKPPKRSPNPSPKPSPKRSATRSKDPFAAVRKAGTNGDNYDVTTADIIARLKKWQKLCSFRVSGLDYNVMTLNFTTLPKDIRAFVRDAYDLCPDLCGFDDDLELPLLEKNMAKTRKLSFWWD
jgi:hypothetical protein